MQSRTHTNTHTQTLAVIFGTQKMHISVQNWRIMYYETKILNVIPYMQAPESPEWLVAPKRMITILQF